MKQKFTQHGIVLDYLKKHKTITPAKMCGSPYKNSFCGSELPKRCRELRNLGILGSFREVEKDGKMSRFVTFFLIK